MKSTSSPRYIDKKKRHTMKHLARFKMFEEAPPFDINHPAISGGAYKSKFTSEEIEFFKDFDKSDGITVMDMRNGMDKVTITPYKIVYHETLVGRPFPFRPPLNAWPDKNHPYPFPFRIEVTKPNDDGYLARFFAELKDGLKVEIFPDDTIYNDRRLFEETKERLVVKIGNALRNIHRGVYSLIK
jgi:hypothetical protein